MVLCAIVPLDSGENAATQVNIYQNRTFKTKDTTRECLIRYYFKLKLLIKYELTKNKLNTICRSIEIYRYPSEINFYCILLFTLSFAKEPCQNYYQTCGTQASSLCQTKIRQISGNLFERA
jgi:hypothetical protein